MKTKITVLLISIAALLTVRGGVIGGIGMVLIKKAGETEPRVMQVLKQSPAAKAGIQPECFVVSIDGAATRNKSLAECVGLVRGPAGTKITLELADFGRTRTNKVTLTRGEVRFDSPVQDGPVRVEINGPKALR